MLNLYTIKTYRDLTLMIDNYHNQYKNKKEFVIVFKPYL